MLLDPPRTLPAGLAHLSVSSMRLFLTCPEKWRRRYVEGEYEPVGPAAILGSAVGRAEGTSYQEQIDSGLPLPAADVLDAFSAEWELELEQRGDRGGIQWEDEKPGKVKDSGARVLGLYHRTVAPQIKPAAVEQRFNVGLPGVDWTFTGYRDLDELSGDVSDFKVRSPGKGVVSTEEAAGDLQVTGYLFSRRAEVQAGLAPRLGDFNFHNFVRGSELAPRNVLVTPAARTEQQLDSFLALLYRVAAEINWRTEHDVWHGPAPGSWQCSERWCGYYRRCVFGGAHRPPRLERPRPLRRPRAPDALAALKATERKSGPLAGTSTAARVGAHLGVSSRSAAGILRGLAARGVVRSERPMRRYKTKPSVPLAGPNVYRVYDDGTVARQLEESVRAVERRREAAVA